jgi:hypothetical protein
MRRQFLSAATLIAILAGAASAQVPADTGWSYQGKVNNNGVPANGSYDMRFSLFADNLGTLPVGTPIVVLNIAVADGLFTTRLDFGAQFNGFKRWLRIEIRPAGTGTYTALPLQEITSTPQANFSLAPWATNASGHISFTGGAVGIGTQSPQTNLHIASPASITSLIDTTGGANAWTMTMYRNANGSWETGTSRSYLNDNFWINRSGSSNVAFQLTPSGALGLGTSAVPSAKFHVFDPASVTTMVETGGGTNAWARTTFKNLNGSWDIGTSRGFHSDAFYISRAGSSAIALKVFPSGQVAIGDPVASGAKLHVYDPASVTSLVETGGGTNAWAKTTYKTGNGSWDIGTSRGFNGDSFYIYRAGAASVAFQVLSSGVTAVQSLMITGGADLAEPFEVSSPADTVQPGMVVVIDENNPGQLRLTDHAYDTKVAGIISGANGLSPGMVMKSEDSTLTSGSHPVAMTGRVWCYVDATFGAIKPGDRLTTSTTPGHAMKADDQARSNGAVIGKAMTELQQGKGLVLVLVNLQ